MSEWHPSNTKKILVMGLLNIEGQGIYLYPKQELHNDEFPVVRQELKSDN